MAIVKCSTLLEQARETNAAVGAFNVANMEMLIGIIAAAEETNTSVILQIAEGRLPYCPLHILGPSIISAASKSSIPISIQLDHGKDENIIKQALELGFPSIMYDGSDLPLVENIEQTHRISELVRSYSAEIEGEIGRLGGSEDENGNREMLYTHFDDAVRFYNQTKVDALAISYGNAHGVYSGSPDLHFDVLKSINENVSCPLVLHGGSGLSIDDFHTSISYGIRKINIATVSCQSIVSGALNYLQAGDNYYEMSRFQANNVHKNVKELIGIFNTSRKDV